MHTQKEPGGLVAAPMPPLMPPPMKGVSPPDAEATTTTNSNAEIGEEAEDEGVITENPCVSEPPAFVHHRTPSGEAVSLGLSMTSAAGWIFPRGRVSESRLPRPSLVRAFERSRIKNLCFDWIHRHEVSVFVDTVASLHRDEESTVLGLNRLYLQNTLPKSALVPAVIDIAHFVPMDFSVPFPDWALELSKLKAAVSPWIAQGLRRVGLLLGQFHDYEIVVNEDPASWTITLKNGTPLTVPGASYTILHESEVLGVCPAGHGFSPRAFPFFEQTVEDHMYALSYGLDEVAASQMEIIVNRHCASPQGEHTPEAGLPTGGQTE